MNEDLKVLVLFRGTILVVTPTTEIECFADENFQYFRLEKKGLKVNAHGDLFLLVEENIRWQWLANPFGIEYDHFSVSNEICVPQYVLDLRAGQIRKIRFPFVDDV